MTFQFKADAFRTDRALPVPAVFSRDAAFQCAPLRPTVHHYSLGIPACLISDNGPFVSRLDIAIDPATRLIAWMTTEMARAVQAQPRHQNASKAQRHDTPGSSR